MLAIFIGGWGVLGFFNKPLVMCFVMHWLYFTVKTHSVPSPATALLPKLPFLQLPFVMLSTLLRRYHLFILWNNNPVKTKQAHPLPTYRLTDGWMDGHTDRCMEGWMYDRWTKSLLDWITGMNESKNEQTNGKRSEINIQWVFVLAKYSIERGWKREKWSGKRSGLELVIPHYVKLNFPSCLSFIWCHYGDCVCLVAGK